VTDSGTGIPESLHERVLEPFFTTQPNHDVVFLGCPSPPLLVAGGWESLPQFCTQIQQGSAARPSNSHPR